MKNPLTEVLQIVEQAKEDIRVIAHKVSIGLKVSNEVANDKMSKEKALDILQNLFRDIEAIVGKYELF